MNWQWCSKVLHCHMFLPVGYLLLPNPVRGSTKWSQQRMSLYIQPELVHDCWQVPEIALQTIPLRGGAVGKLGASPLWSSRHSGKWSTPETSTTPVANSETGDGVRACAVETPLANAGETSYARAQPDSPVRGVQGTPPAGKELHLVVDGNTTSVA